MSNIKSRDQLILRSAMYALGSTFAQHQTNAPGSLRWRGPCKPLLGCEALKSCSLSYKIKFRQGEMPHGMGFLEGVEGAGSEVMGDDGVVHIHAIGIGVECGLGDSGDSEIGGVEALDT